MPTNATGSSKLYQLDLIRCHLREHGWINRAEAEYLYGVQSLASRICELRRAGLRVESALMREGGGKRCAIYRLRKR